MIPFTSLLLDPDRSDAIFVLRQEALQILRGYTDAVERDAVRVDLPILILNDVKNILELSAAECCLQDVQHNLSLRIRDHERAQGSQWIDFKSKRCGYSIQDYYIHFTAFELARSTGTR